MPEKTVKRLQSVQFKFIGLMTLLVLLLLSLLISYPLISSRDLIFKEKETSLTNQASALASSLSSLDSLSRDSIAEVITLLDIDTFDRIVVVNRGGRVIYDTASQDNLLGRMSNIDALETALKGKTVFRSRFTKAAFISSAAVPVEDAGEIVGAVMLYEEDKNQANLIVSIQHRIAMVSIAICVFALLADIIMTRLLTKRIRTLAEMTKRVADGDYDQRFESTGGDEVAELGREFNELTERLAVTERRRRQFVSDASHELKTPIAAITLLSDSIVQNEDMDMETIREFVSDISHEANRMQRTTEELLDLSRLDDDMPRHVELINVERVVNEALLLLRPLAEQKSVTIDKDLDEDCCVLATEDDIYHIIFNLAENAIKYNVERGSVKIELHDKANQVELTVKDTGIGIPEDAREEIFSRFFRVDKARSREAGGSGLGLSIVHDAVLRHGGTVSVYENEPQGSCFVVRFPKPEE